MSEKDDRLFVSNQQGAIVAVLDVLKGVVYAVDRITMALTVYGRDGVFAFPSDGKYRQYQLADACCCLKG